MVQCHCRVLTSRRVHKHLCREDLATSNSIKAVAALAMDIEYVYVHVTIFIRRISELTAPIGLRYESAFYPELYHFSCRPIEVFPAKLREAAAGTDILYGSQRLSFSVRPPCGASAIPTSFIGRHLPVPFSSPDRTLSWPHCMEVRILRHCLVGLQMTWIREYGAPNYFEGKSAYIFYQVQVLLNVNRV
jgi:hypothetical protein